ncbi:hypothetical protein JTE90_005311 [Oedothorax gibbosus]|uniref:MADF domain-containing protein n=1 Tax=Oedothorax gibbosus TaxID=931172 RepID=A0AAV6UHK1_9ARAC|nr:hypothetical protein JTE90_005311 [Oedothorax gibbosus]
MATDFSTYSEEEKIIAEIAKRPVLYQVDKKSFKDTVAKDNNWLEIEKVLNIKVEELKRRWKTIRDYYVRNSKRMPTGSKAKKKKVDERRMRCLSFLDNYSLARSTYSNFPGNNEGLFNESLAAGEGTCTQAAGEGTSTQNTEEGTATQDTEKCTRPKVKSGPRPKMKSGPRRPKMMRVRPAQVKSGPDQDSEWTPTRMQSGPRPDRLLSHNQKGSVLKRKNPSKRTSS